MRFLALFIAFFAFMPPAFSAGDIDITGEWNAMIPGLGYGFQRTLMDLEAKDAKLAGSLIVGENETYILDGKINGDKISFKTKGRLGNTNVEYKYDGKILSANEIEFKIKSSLINSPTNTFTARRKLR